MAKLTFPGGIQLSGEKQLTKDAPFINLFPEGELVFPLSQHIGEPAVPVVRMLWYLPLALVAAKKLFSCSRTCANSWALNKDLFAHA